MSLNLNIPITQTLTLPDSWQACKTPQELSYWIIAKFEGFTSSISEINSALTGLGSMIETNTNNIATNDAEIAEIKTSIANINTTLGEINTSITSLNSDYSLLHSNYMAMNNRLATVEDAAGDIPTIKNDITLLNNIVKSQGQDIANMGDRIIEATGMMSAAFNLDYNTYIDYNDVRNNNYRIPLDLSRCYSTIFMKVGSVDSRLKIAEGPEIPTIGFTCNLYYYSDNNVTFGTINNTTPAGTDISEKLKTYSIDGSTAIADIMAKTNVAIKIFKVDNESRPYAWTLL